MPAVQPPGGHDGLTLAQRLGVEVRPGLLERALTHRSWSAEHEGAPHSERLELLGDAVLDLAVTAWLHAHDARASEGVLSRRRAALVCEASLADVARAIPLGPELRLGRGETGSGGADKDSLLADALEAVIGAVFVTAGYDVTAALVVRLFGERLQAATDPDEHAGHGGPIDPKTALQERLAALGRSAPVYETEREGPDHAPTFRADVVVDGVVIGQGHGGSKKAASQAAAAQALRSDRLG